MVTTYIIAGHDHNGAFKESLETWEKRASEKGDVVIIRPKQGDTAKEIAKQIKVPANVIIESHGGSNGSFIWNKDQAIFYDDVFKELPRSGIGIILPDTCFGGSSLGESNYLPHGTILYSTVSGSVPAIGSGVSARFSKELTAYKEITPLAIILESLDSTEPNAYVRVGNTKDILAKTIIIGGSPPVDIYLDQKLAELSVAGKSGKLDKVKFDQSVAKV